MKRESPRIRRLRSDHRALEQLREDSTIFDFSADGECAEIYTVSFSGAGLWRPADQKIGRMFRQSLNEVVIRNDHKVRIELGASYPRMMPNLSWLTPIFHPNISSAGVVCLGEYGTYWAPSLDLAELCHMLWDMIRYQNYDVDSPYNREAAIWAKEQTMFHFPVDPRPLRDKIALSKTLKTESPPIATPPPDITILSVDSPVLEAELVNEEDPDEGILFLD